ncbi:MULTISPECIES: hypothetical protein [Streptomyces]|uniref:Uncharacterized protein n=2 Tax=Streptomyces TaxID=1883 RepID=A0A1E7LPQ8_9ACTN|nr:hypothetical protein [Streptomyces nanshensis]OEV18161.1 hypothetical protein AN221_23765 [Streptomyces nanshensis]
MSEREPLGVQITAREIYDELRDMRGEVRTMAQHLDTDKTAIADHEARIRAIERWKYSIPAAVLMGIASVAVEVARATGGK